jgi:hypothetical protein
LRAKFLSSHKNQQDIQLSHSSSWNIGPVALPSHAAAGLDSYWDLGRFAQHLQYKKRKNRNPFPSIIITQNRDLLAFTIEKILPAPFPKDNIRTRTAITRQNTRTTNQNA